MALAQDATPSASPATAAHTVTLSTPDGDIAGMVEITEGADGVTFAFESTSDSTLEPGPHGIHIHEVGSCDASGEKPYDSAGGHFNPEEHMHGAPDDDDSHAGDLGNIDIGKAGDGTIDITTKAVTLSPGPTSLLGGKGTSIVMHAMPDDERTDPSGNTGARIACGAITP